MRGFSAGRVRRTEARRRSRAPALAVAAPRAAPRSLPRRRVRRRAGRRLRRGRRRAGAPRFSVTLAAVGLAVLVLVLAAIALASSAPASARRARRRAVIAELEAELAAAAPSSTARRSILRSEPQIVIAWDRPDAEPTIEGDLAPRRRRRRAAPHPALRLWLEPEAAAGVEEAIGAAARSAARPSPCRRSSLARRHLEIVGRPVSGSAVVRMRDVSGDRLEAGRMREKVAETEACARTRCAGRSKARRSSPGDATREGRLVWCNARLRPRRRGRRRQGRGRQGAELFDPGLRREAAAALQRDRGLETPRRRGRRRRAANLRSGRSRRAAAARPASPATSRKPRRCRPRWSATRTTIRA